MNVLIKNYNINYIEEGSGDIVLLLHGWGSNYKCFNALINLLKDKYNVLAIDLPGFGDSEDLKESLYVDDYVNIVNDFINYVFSIKNVNKNIILFGHSFGGRIIIKLNSRNDLKYNIKKNVLIDAAGIKDKKDIKVKLKIYCYKTLKNIIKFLPISDNNKNIFLDNLKNKFGSNDYKNSSKYLRETLINSVNEDLTNYLKKMKESLIIWGNKDTTTPLYMAKIMEKEINNSGLVILNGGHFSFLDDSYTFLKVIKSYLSI